MQRYVKTSCMVKKILHTKKLFAEKYPWRIPYFRSSPPFRYWNWPPPPPSSSSLLLFTVFSLPPLPPSDLGIAPQLTSFSPQPNATFFWSKVFYFLKKLSMCRNILGVFLQLGEVFPLLKNSRRQVKFDATFSKKRGKEGNYGKV